MKLRVTWGNATSPLLCDALAEIRVVADGEVLPVARLGEGARDVDIPGGAARVELSARFSASLEAVGDAPPLEHEVLWADQAYEVADGGAALKPLPDAAYGHTPHPLIETKAVRGARGVFEAQIKTDFVDVTPFWMAYAANADEYTRDHQPGTELVALGLTSGDPKIWFASVPEACLAPPGESVSALVFFRPESYPYGRIDEAHDMFGLSRYLLTPDSSSSAEFWARDHFASDPRDQSRWIWVRCGFEAALAASGKAVVMLHPWPSGSSFGLATSSRLPALADAALRFLWATGRLANGRAGVRLGRLALSGFSAGGLALWSALSNNLNRVSEVFSFDARGVSSSATTIARWFNGSASRKLRMTGGYQLGSHASLRNAILRGGRAVTGRLTIVPASKDGYAPGINPRWDHTLSDLTADEKARLSGADYVWHQFAIFGDYPDKTAATAQPPASSERKPEEQGERAQPVSVLQRFLQASDL